MHFLLSVAAFLAVEAAYLALIVVLQRRVARARDRVVVWVACLPLLTAASWNIFDWEREFIAHCLAAGIAIWFVPSRALCFLVRRGTLYELQQSGLPPYALFAAVVLPGNIQSTNASAESMRTFSFWVLAKAVIIQIAIFVVVPLVPPTGHLFTVFGAFFLYIWASLIFDSSAMIGMALFHFHYRKSFDRPYMSVSLSDFWSRRWNLMVSQLLRESVYDSIRLEAKRRDCSERQQRYWQLVAMLSCFLMSAVMHEILLTLILRQLTYKWLMFFSLQGLLTVAEVLIRQTWPKTYHGTPSPVRWFITMTVLVVSGTKLFIEPLADAPFSKAVRELSPVGAFFVNLVR